MAKHPTRQVTRVRLQDALAGIKPGKVDLHPRGMDTEPEPEPPSIDELGVPLTVRMELKRKVEKHVALGKAIKQASKEREAIGDEIRPLLLEHVGEMDEYPKVMIAGEPVSRYMSTRTSLSKDILLSLGVSPAVIKKATVTKNITNLRIGGKGDDDE